MINNQNASLRLIAFLFRGQQNRLYISIHDRSIKMIKLMAYYLMIYTHRDQGYFQETFKRTNDDHKFPVLSFILRFLT